MLEKRKLMKRLICWFSASGDLQVEDVEEGVYNGASSSIGFGQYWQSRCRGIIKDERGCKGCRGMDGFG